ncbi:MAG TPA: TrkH family potassium uptake protein [Thermotogota bacterium]|nr:TrkH family potassium uptake protein [Thermotogota bacterium]HPJ88042.1 TrkH family potassium uptake protein [Thermotogota bacterium]HPR96227.1 TrkH family potassium uptake protein [Thermotogota bacterium]
MSYRRILRTQYSTIFTNLGWMLMAFSAILLLPLLFLFFYPEEVPNAIYFVESAALSFITGYILWFMFNKKAQSSKLTIHEGAIIVFFVWLAAVFFSALPFVFANILNLTHAIFESTSGWTTTGLTLVHEEKIPRLFLVWRSLMQYFGGAGFAIIMLSSIGGGVSSGIYAAEGRMDNLQPHIKKSTKTILSIYFTYALIGFSAYVFAGMSPFDAFNHALTGLATGGFSTRHASIGYYNSVPIEIITIVLMTLGTTGFGIHYLLWSGDFKRLKKNVEPWTYFIILVIFIPLIASAVFGSVYTSLPESIRQSTFQAVSALTGTGFATTDMTVWNHYALLLMTLLMIFGGMMDSTSGGLKLFRIFVIFKAIWIEIENFFLPKGTVRDHRAWKGNVEYKIDSDLLRNILIFTTLYVLNYTVGVVVLVAHGHDFMTAAFEYASALSTVGLSLGITSTSAPDAVIWTETIGMFLGRLEFIIILYAIAKIFRDLKQYLQSGK